MRNGNLIEKVDESNLPDWVLILPMRNGNQVVTLRDGLYFLGSYPTYEEWKLGFFIDESKTEKIVLILPMRNGNMLL